MIYYLIFLAAVTNPVVPVSPIPNSPPPISPTQQAEVPSYEIKYTPVTPCEPETLKLVLEFTHGKIKPLPKPTKEINDLVKDLGDDNCHIRDSAQHELFLMKRDALSAIEEGCKNEDLEIKLRCQSLIDGFYNEYDSVPESIYYLTNEIRFPDGVGKRDIAKEYFIKAKKEMNHWCGAYEIPSIGNDLFQRSDVEKIAVILFFHDLMRDGDLNSKQIKELGDDMTKWQDELVFPYKNMYPSYEGYGYGNDGSDRVPSPAEPKPLHQDYGYSEGRPDAG